MKIWDEVELKSTVRGLGADRYKHKWMWVIVEDDWSGVPFKVRREDDWKTDWWYDRNWDLIPFKEKIDKIKIGELNCVYSVVNNTIDITYKHYKYTTNFYWEPKTWYWATYNSLYHA